MEGLTDTYAVIITGVIGLITTIVSAWLSWFFARKKYNSEVDGQVIQNMKESLDFYKQLSDDNTSRLNQVLAQNKEILEQNAKLLEQNTKLEQEVKELKIQIKDLMEENKTAKGKKKSNETES